MRRRHCRHRHQQRDDRYEENGRELAQDRQNDTRGESADIHRRELPRCAPQEVDGAKHETGDAEVGRDERGVRGNVRFDGIEHQRDDGRTKSQPLQDPEEDKDAEANAQENDHETRPIEQAIGIGVDVEEGMTELEWSAERDCLRRDDRTH